METNKALTRTNTVAFEFENKTIVITGAGGAFGKAASLYFATLGAKICMLDFNEFFLNEAFELVEKVIDKSKILTFVCDVRNKEEIDKVITQIEGTFNVINYLFNNAGYQGEFEKTQNYSNEDFKSLKSMYLEPSMSCKLVQNQ